MFVPKCPEIVEENFWNVTPEPRCYIFKQRNRGVRKLTWEGSAPGEITIKIGSPGTVSFISLFRFKAGGDSSFISRDENSNSLKAVSGLIQPYYIYK